MEYKFVPKEFYACLTFDGITVNTSSSGYSWKVTCDKKVSYYMMRRDMEKLLKNFTIAKGMIKGKWKTRKQGGTSGIQLLEQDNSSCENCEYKVQCALNNGGEIR